MRGITPRKRKDGTVGYMARVRIKRAGKIIYAETQTFDREQAAKIWLKKRETELAEPGALEKPVDPLLADVIDKYIKDTRKDFGKTKKQVLNTIKNSQLGELRCSEIGSQQIVEYARSITAQPQTVGNYLSHLASVVAVARPAWGYPLDSQAMADARVVAVRMGLVSRSKERDRRPTLDEVNRLMTYFEVSESKRSDAIKMTKLIAFAIFSTRRQEEICRVTFEDLSEQHLELVVRDMKNPGEKIGNDVRTQLTPEALRLIKSQPHKTGRIWPHNAESVSTSFRRACQILGIVDLHFHDLRHEGISRLFEMGWTIPQVATVSGHRSWKSLQRYAHIRQAGDKYAGWEWMKKLTPQE